MIDELLKNQRRLLVSWVPLITFDHQNNFNNFNQRVIVSGRLLSKDKI